MYPDPPSHIQTSQDRWEDSLRHRQRSIIWVPDPRPDNRSQKFNPARHYPASQNESSQVLPTGLIPKTNYPLALTLLRDTMTSDPEDVLDTVEGEISLFRSIMRTRPIGIHRHVHMLAIHSSIYRETGFKVPIKDIWVKLGKMYDLDALEHAEFNGEDPNSGSNTPSPDENLQIHPSFKEEFNLFSHDESYESYFAARRVRPASATPTPPPSPRQGPDGTGSAPNSSIRESEVGKKQRHKEKLKLAGLDDSDSSALTQSGDEVEESSPVPQDPSRPGTEVGTEVGEGEDMEVAEHSSLELAPVAKPIKFQKAVKKGTPARTRSGAAAASSRPTKKRKR